MVLEVRFEEWDDRLRHRDVPDACGRLRTADLDPGRELLALLAHDDAAVQEVEVCTREAEQLAEAQPARRRQEQERAVQRVDRLNEREGAANADSHAARSTPLQAYSKRKRRPPHQGTLVSEMSAERSTGE